jgi:hypothetical protein
MNIHFSDPVTHESLILDLNVLPRKDDVVEINGRRFTVWRTIHKMIPNNAELKYVEGVAVACRPNIPYSQVLTHEGQFSVV